VAAVLFLYRHTQIDGQDKLARGNGVHVLILHSPCVRTISLLEHRFQSDDWHILVALAKNIYWCIWVYIQKKQLGLLTLQFLNSS